MKGGVRRNRTLLNHSRFSTIEKEADAYWLGFLMADGCVHDSKRGAKRLDVGLAPYDYGHLVKLQTYLEMKRWPRYVGDHRATLSLSSDPICDSLIRYGCVPRKTGIVEYPTIPSHLDAHLIRGYFDGNGCVSMSHRRDVSVTVAGSRAWLEGCKRVMGLTYKVQNKGGCCSLRLCNLSTLGECYEFLYTDATVWLERKRLKYEDCLFVRAIRKRGNRWHPASF